MCLSSPNQPPFLACRKIVFHETDPWCQKYWGLLPLASICKWANGASSHTIVVLILAAVAWIPYPLLLAKKIPVCVLVLSRVWLFVIPWTVAHQAPLSKGFPRQKYWRGLPCPSPGDLSTPGTERTPPALAGEFFTIEPPEKLSAHFSHSVVSNSLWSHGLQHTRPPCPSPTPRDYSNSCPLRQWCHPTISSSVVPFSSCLQSFPASGSFPMNQLFAWGGQSIGSFSFSISPSNEHSGLISFRI